MSSFRRFEDIEAWQLGRELTRDVYTLTRTPGFVQDFALRDQIRRACISVTSNIAEGHERSTPRDFARFLSIPRASCAEVRSRLYCALDQHYVTPDDFARLTTLCVRIGAALASLIRYLLSTTVSEPATSYDAADPPTPDLPLTAAFPLNPSTPQP